MPSFVYRTLSVGAMSLAVLLPTTPALAYDDQDPNRSMIERWAADYSAPSPDDYSPSGDGWGIRTNDDGFEETIVTGSGGGIGEPDDTGPGDDMDCWPDDSQGGWGLVCGSRDEHRQQQCLTRVADWEYDCQGAAAVACGPLGPAADMCEWTISRQCRKVARKLIATCYGAPKPGWRDLFD